MNNNNRKRDRGEGEDDYEIPTKRQKLNDAMDYENTIWGPPIMQADPLWTPYTLRRPTGTARNLSELYRHFMLLEEWRDENLIILNEQKGRPSNMINSAQNREDLYNTLYKPLFQNYMDINHPDISAGSNWDLLEGYWLDHDQDDPDIPDVHWRPDFPEFERHFVNDAIAGHEKSTISERDEEEVTADESLGGFINSTAWQNHLFLDSQYPVLKASELTQGQFVPFRGDQFHENRSSTWRNDLGKPIGNQHSRLHMTYRPIAEQILQKKFPSEREFTRFLSGPKEYHEWERTEVMEDLYGEEGYSSTQTNATNFINNQGK
jgi:hypothetical protein